MDSSRFDPFIFNESHHVPLYDIDPDTQFHLDTHHMKNTNYDYYCEDTMLIPCRERGSPKYILAASF